MVLGYPRNLSQIHKRVDLDFRPEEEVGITRSGLGLESII